MRTKADIMKTEKKLRRRLIVWSIGMAWLALLIVLAGCTVSPSCLGYRETGHNIWYTDCEE